MLGETNSGEHIQYNANHRAHVIKLFVRLLIDVSDLLARLVSILHVHLWKEHAVSLLGSIMEELDE